MVLGKHCLSDRTGMILDRSNVGLDPLNSTIELSPKVRINKVQRGEEIKKLKYLKKNLTVFIDHAKLVYPTMWELIETAGF